jgi:TetR/AcrR family transcriptional regulator, tetracycline repressor protein
MPVSRQDVVRAAIALVDEAGLEGFTLRRLAEQLGIRAPTLYWHVKDKRELLDLMADAILTEALDGWRQPAPGQPWPDWVAGLARRERSALLAHRDSALVLSGNVPIPQTLPALEQEVQALVDAGFPPAHAVLTLRAISAYVVGEVLDTQGEADRQNNGRYPPAAGHDSSTDPGLDPSAADALPLLRAAAVTQVTPDERFEHGLTLIIDGLRAQLAAASSL